MTDYETADILEFNNKTTDKIAYLDLNNKQLSQYLNANVILVRKNKYFDIFKPNKYWTHLVLMQNDKRIVYINAGIRHIQNTDLYLIYLLTPLDMNQYMAFLLEDGEIGKTYLYNKDHGAFKIMPDKSIKLIGAW